MKKVGLLFFFLILAFLVGCGKDEEKTEPNLDIEVKDSTNIGDNSFYLEFKNDVSSIDFNEYITVAADSTWKLFEDASVKKEIESKSIELDFGENLFFVKVIGCDSSFSTYRIIVYRLSICNVEFETNGGTRIKEQKIEENSLVSNVESPEKNGYTFKGWDYDFSKPVTSDLKINAIWEANKYCISFDVNCGFLETISVSYDESIKLPEPTKVGHTFTGWYYNGEKIANDFTYNYDCDITLVAGWALAEYTLTFDLDGGELDTSETIKVLYKENVKLPEPTRKGYTFTGWIYNKETFSEQLTYNYDCNITMVATWSANEYLITLDVNGGKLDSDGKMPVFYDEDIVLPEPAKEGYTFTGWYFNDEFIGDEIAYEYDYNIELVATWSANEYLVSYYLGNELINSQKVIYDDIFTVSKEISTDDYYAKNWISGSNVYDGGKDYTYRQARDIKLYVNETVYKGDDFEYSSSDNGVTLVNYNGNQSIIIVPTYIETSNSTIKVLGFSDEFTFTTGESIYISEGITSITPILFLYLKTIVNITIPKSVTNIDGAFYGCENLENVYYSGTLEDWFNVTLNFSFNFESPMFYASNLYLLDENNEWVAPVDVVIPDGISKVGYHLMGIDSITTLTIPSSVVKFNSSAFSSTDNIESVYYEGTVEDWCNITFSNFFANPMYYADYFYISDENNKWYEPTEIVIPDSVSDLSFRFMNFSSVVSFVIPEGVTVIGDSAFYGCDSIENIVIPEGVTVIGDSAFGNCTSLLSVSIPEGVTSIGKSPFKNCSSLQSIQLPTQVEEFNTLNAFEGCTSLVSINIPEGVEELGWSAFEGCTSLTSINIPESVTEISSSAFEGCTSLTSINIPDGVEKLYSYAFSGCTSLVNANIPGSITSVSSGLFSGCSSLISINISEGVTAIDDYAFSSCTSLTSVNIPEGVTSIGCSTFENCSSLTSIIIPKGITAIGSYAFSGCSSLKDVYYKGTIEDWCNIKVSSNPVKGGTNSHFYMLDENNEWFEPTEIIVPDSITNIRAYCFSGFDNVTSITLPESVERIEHEAFYGCSSLTNINIPATVTYIGSYAFSESKITSIILPKSITTIESGVFQNCKNLENISIPESVTSIKGWAFKDCDSLKNVILPKSITSIGEFAFFHCDSLESIFIPSSVDSIGNAAFSWCLKVNIYCEANSKPVNWSSSWNPDKRPVVWGYTGE